MEGYAASHRCSLHGAATSLATENKKLAEFLKIFNELRTALDSVYLSELIKLIVQQSGYQTWLKGQVDDVAESRMDNLKELEAVARQFEQEQYDGPREEDLTHYDEVAAGTIGHDYLERVQGLPVSNAAGGAQEGNAEQEIVRERTHRETAAALLDRVSLTSSADVVKPDEKEEVRTQEFVSLMTLHLAKGLEFPIVFFTGVEEGLCPHARSLNDPRNLEEERRLCYVGITRAMKRLYLTCSLSRGMTADISPFRMPSRFLADIPDEVKKELEETY